MEKLYKSSREILWLDDIIINYNFTWKTNQKALINQIHLLCKLVGHLSNNDTLIYVEVNLEVKTNQHALTRVILYSNGI